MRIPIIDIFAGPGGLSEGFSAFRNEQGEKVFQIKLSVEKDAIASKTLTLRSFFRQFPDGEAPQAYYRYLAGEISVEDLFDAFPRESQQSLQEVLNVVLGTSNGNKQVNARLRQLLKNQNWVLIGGPPCQAYSIIGRSRRTKDEGFEDDQRHLLYKEYLKILARYKPAIFVMENVKGMLSAKLNNKPIIQQIFLDLQSPRKALKDQPYWDGYDPTYQIYSLVVPCNDHKTLKPEDYVIRSENYGIPQKRHRVILLGIRSNGYNGPKRIKKERILLTPYANPETQIQEQIPISRVIGDLPPLRSKISRRRDNYNEWFRIIANTINQPFMQEIQGIPRGNVIAQVIQQTIENIQELTSGTEYTQGVTIPDYNPERWYSDPHLLGISNHVARGHMITDLYRYFFVCVYGQVHQISPRIRDFPLSLLPNHQNVIARLENAEEVFEDRFRVQLAHLPATTITSHISKDGHYNIHYAPTQCRSLTVREAARIQTFPDNYFFEGNRTEQYHQVGNAVPPILAHQIAAVVYDLLSD